jgi:hypothetical protein
MVFHAMTSPPRAAPLDDLRLALQAPDGRTWRRHFAGARSWRRRAPELAGVVVLGAAAILAVSALRPSTASTAGRGATVPTDPAPMDTTPATTPPTTTTTVARLWPAEPVEVEGREVRTGGHRWEVGDEGDVVAVGDWDCDRTPTPAVLRPSTGLVAVFDRWAEAGEEATARPVATVADAIALRATTRCGRVSVQRADGTAQEITTTKDRP